jgi:glyoxylase-like metal-dependent hydrolase (beta-lactamase superfamily II)
VFAGDVIPTSAHLSLDWLDAHDIDPLTALAGKQSMLEEAVKEGQWIIFPHDAQLPCAKICKKEDFQILEKEMLNE